MPKPYLGHVSFKSISVRVTAKNKKSARKKILAAVAKKSPRRLVDFEEFEIES